MQVIKFETDDLICRIPNRHQISKVILAPNNQWRYFSLTSQQVSKSKSHEAECRILTGLDLSSKHI